MKHIKRLIIAIIWGLSCLFCWHIGEGCGVDKEAHDDRRLK